MLTISATEFKAKCLQLLDRVFVSGERIRVTKHGRVVAEVGPPAEEVTTSPRPGFAKGSLRIVGDIIEPIEAVWEVLR